MVNSVNKDLASLRGLLHSEQMAVQRAGIDAAIRSRATVVRHYAWQWLSENLTLEFISVLEFGDVVGAAYSTLLAEFDPLGMHSVLRDLLYSEDEDLEALGVLCSSLSPSEVIRQRAWQWLADNLDFERTRGGVGTARAVNRLLLEFDPPPADSALARMVRPDGSAYRYTCMGTYPWVYFADDGGVLCADCVTEMLDLCLDSSAHGWYVVACDVNWEDPSLRCDHCTGRIESAYADDDDDNDNDDDDKET